MLYLRKADGSGQAAAMVTAYTVRYDMNGSSSVSIFGEWSGYEGGLICSPELEWAGVIKTMTPKDGVTTISADHPTALMDRSVEWLGTYSEEDLGALVSAIVTDNFGAGQADPFYANPWLSVDIAESGSCAKPELDDFGMFNAKSFLQDLADCGKLHLTAVPVDGGILLTDHPNEDANTAFFDTINCDVESENYSSTVVAKITDHFPAGDGTTTAYYLLEDGTVTTDPSAVGRIDGLWKHTKKQGEEKVKEEFAKNSFSHKIQFKSTILKRPGATIVLRTKDGRVVNTLITTVERKPDDDRISYECGNLAITLTEVLKRNGK